MALYQLLKIGVLKTDTMQRIIPQSGALWHAYQQWVRAGNEPDPYIPPVEPAETLAHARKRRMAELKREGLTLVQQRFPGIRNFDTLRMVREIMLSISPAARAPTTDMTWLQNMWQEGEDLKAAVQAATTVAQVDAVSPTWPT